MKRSMTLGLLLLAATYTCGCLHTYHDYNGEPEEYRGEGFSMWGGPRLYYAPGQVVDGKIVDTANAYWFIYWAILPDDSIRELAYIQCDSLWIWPGYAGDTLRCDSVQFIKPRSGTNFIWSCPDVTFARLNSPEITVSMVVRFVRLDGTVHSRHKVVWPQKLKKTVIHSDY